MSCDRERHAEIKSNTASFLQMTRRLPHCADCETYQDDGEGRRIWLRLCLVCESTLGITVDSDGEMWR